MKLRDLARGSGNPTSLLPAFHILRSRFGNRETARVWRKPYESVPISASITLHLLTLLQQTTMVPTHSILRRPRHPGSPATLHIRTHHGNRSVCRRPVSLYCLIFKQNKSEVYREVLIAGDLTEEDVATFSPSTLQVGWLPYSGNTPDITKLFYGNDTVYFAQPDPSQFVPGGSEPGTFNQSDTSNNAPILTGRNALRRDTGAVLRYAPSAC